MNSKLVIPESVVIVRNEHGATATIRYKDGKRDRILSSSSPKPNGIHRLIEEHVMGKKYDKKEK